MEHLDSPWSRLVGTEPAPIAEAGLADAAAAAVAAAAPPVSVPRRQARDLSYQRFCLEHLEPNLPVLIEGATEGWAAAQDWVAADGSVDLDFLERRFGAAQVLVTDTARRHQGGGSCERMRLAHFLSWWRQHRQQKQCQQQLQQRAAASAAGQEDEKPLWYCKDWHLAPEFPDYQAYSCPAWFQDDWLNEWFDARQEQGAAPAAASQQQQQQQQGVGSAVQASDYRFVYLGPAGTSTPLHADVLRSYSWSANIAGRKLWRLLPPQYTHLLMDRHGHDAAWDFYADDADGEFPGLAEARGHLLTLVQQPGEALFVPSGWFHTVENLDDCVSINHNWFNGHNAAWVWALLRCERQQAEAAIEDCRELCSPTEFEGLVQRNLGANAGLDWAGLGALLRCIANHSLALLAAGQVAASADQAAQQAAAGQPASTDEQSVAAAAGAGAAVGLAAQQETALADPGYHVFRLQRAGLILRQLLEEQRRMDNAGCSGDGGAKHAQHEGQPAAEQQQVYHAAEIAANAACLQRLGQQLQALGLESL